MMHHKRHCSDVRKAHRLLTFLILILQEQRSWLTIHVVSRVHLFTQMHNLAIYTYVRTILITGSNDEY
jgi:hypothetical protein